MSAFDRIRRADAQRRIQTDVRALASFSMAVLDDTDSSTEADVLPGTALWEGPIGFEDQMTGDGRLIKGGALRWDFDVEAPNLRYVREDVGAHDGAVTVGKVLGIERRAGGVIWAYGDLDLSSEDGREAYRQVKEERQNGVSMDMDDVSFEVRVAGELFDEMQEMLTDLLAEDEPVEEPVDDDPDEPDDADDDEPDRDEDGRVTVATVNSDDEVMVTTSARIRALTMVAVPAFAGARIQIAHETPA